MIRIRLLVLFLPLVAIAQQNAESGDKSMILALERAWNQAEIHNGTNAASALMADTFISVDHHGTLLNKAQYLAGIKDRSFRPQEISSSETSVYIYGDGNCLQRVSHQRHGQRQALPTPRPLHRYLD